MPHIFFSKTMHSMFILSLLFLIPPGPLEASGAKTIAMIPFETNSQKDLSYIQSGVLKMCHARLASKDNVKMIPQHIVDDALQTLDPASETHRVREIGRRTHADYVITGIITEFSDAYSIDIKVYHLKDNFFHTFYSQTENIDLLIPGIDVVAAKINKKIFDRTTLSYEKFKARHTITEEALRRMNPEKMMPAHPRGDEKKPWWKIW